MISFVCNICDKSYPARLTEMGAIYIITKPTGQSFEKLKMDNDPCIDCRDELALATEEVKKKIRDKKHGESTTQ